eukprot:403368669
MSEEDQQQTFDDQVTSQSLVDDKQVSNTQEQFDQFLAQRRINVDSLKGTSEQRIYDVDSQRNIAIIKARAEAYPHQAYENYRLKADLLGHLSESLHEACLNAVAEENGRTLLTVPEGIKFRNCLTKFSITYATLQRSMQSREWVHNQQQALRQAQKKDESLRILAQDPWEQESSQLFEQLKDKKYTSLV